MKGKSKNRWNESQKQEIITNLMSCMPDIPIEQIKPKTKGQPQLYCSVNQVPTFNHIDKGILETRQYQGLKTEEEVKEEPLSLTACLSLDQSVTTEEGKENSFHPEVNTLRSQAESEFDFAEEPSY